MVAENHRKSKDILELIAGGDIEKSKFISSLSVSEVYRLINDYLSKSKRP